MNIKTFDDDAFAVDAESYFNFWCCDCNLRHLVVVEAIGNGSDVFKSNGGKIALAFSRDDAATKLSRKADKIVLYKRKQ
ncbi:hypothetical protein CMI47_16500 [Candidatus Pacearchaeota archaeon]|jgi:hypothetical protein|nr:hypothetical protein [Candidatus Pacearchaeota archaeon]|tara:strand:+ start:216 stop:452 length:237 start_codon:yes stop_codon:yes gene_type:complete